MKAIQLLAVICLMRTSCLGQEFRELLRPDESVLQPQTDRLTSIRMMARQLATEHPALPVATRAHYLVCETYCIHCPARKADFIRRGWPESNVLTNDECQSRFGFRVPKVPYEFEEPVEVVKTKVIRSSSQTGNPPVSNCPGGVCPTSSRPTLFNRGGIFRRR